MIYENIITDEAAIEDEEGLKSVAELVQTKRLPRINSLGYYFNP